MRIIMKEDANQCCIKAFSVFLSYSQPLNLPSLLILLLFQLVFVSLKIYNKIFERISFMSIT